MLDSDIKNVENNDIMNVIQKLNETKVFFNKPAKDIYYNLGGIRTTLPLLVSHMHFKPDSTESEYNSYKTIVFEYAVEF